MALTATDATAASALLQTAVIIPARNEQQSIGLVLDDLPPVACVIVCDNGSSDDTAQIAADADCVVVHEPIAGYGRACLTGMAKLQSLVADSTLEIQYVAFVDADYSDHPQELIEMIRLFLEDVDKGKVDFVIGSRMLGRRERGAMPLQAVMGNRLACLLMKLLWGTDYTDLGPFRVIRYDSLMQLGMQDLNFGWTIEMQIKAKLAGLSTIEIPVSYRRRVGVSKISGTVWGTIRAGYKILFTIAKYAVRTRNGSDRRRSSMPDAAAPVNARKPA